MIGVILVSFAGVSSNLFRVPRLLLYTDILVFIVGSRQYLEKPYKHSAYISTYIHSP